jgi:alkanesulfonate monooxygenase SsuD/methylene tetrahydromethanopterin reductase-like flavin-dependent oxidoreductase (luciferase family)
MKLDLLYEIQPKVRPWDLPFPYGQRKAEQESFDEAIEQIQFADRLGFNTAWYWGVWLCRPHRSGSGSG